MLAFMTKPSNFSAPVNFGLGLTVLTIMGTAVSTTMGATTGIGPCAQAGDENPAASNTAANPEPASNLNDFIPNRP
jgi:hypothetical protein